MCYYKRYRKIHAELQEVLQNSCSASFSRKSIDYGNLETADYSDLKIESSDRKISFELAQWGSKHNRTRPYMNDLFHVLNSNGLNLPKHSRTLLQTKIRNIMYIDKCGRKCLYFGSDILISKLLVTS